MLSHFCRMLFILKYDTTVNFLEIGRLSLIDKEIEICLKKKVIDEITRIKKEITAQLQNQNQISQLTQHYTIKQFVNDIMQYGFSEKYLAETKMTSQKGSRGVSTKKEMKFCDLNYIIGKLKNIQNICEY